MQREHIIDVLPQIVLSIRFKLEYIYILDSLIISKKIYEKQLIRMIFIKKPSTIQYDKINLLDSIHHIDV